MNRVDWSYMKRPILVFLGSIFCSVFVVAAAYRYEQLQTEVYQQSISTLSSTHELYRNIVNDIDLFDQYRNLYGGYKASGLIGKERRLSWIESLKTTNETLRLPSLTYNLNPQEEFRRPGFKLLRGVKVQSSAMNLSMGLLHEEDLFALVRGLRRSIKSLFTIDRCQITRNSGIGSSLDLQKPNLDARCTFRWITIDVK